MATSDVEICNLALDKCKEKNITSLEENTKAAEKCKAWYDLIRKSLLTNLNASFAIDRAVLAKKTDYIKIYGYDNAYQLPFGCLQVLNVGSPLENILYQVEGDNFYCNVNEKNIYIRYIKDVEDVTKFDSNFIRLFALTLASEICEPLTHDTEQANYLKKLAQEQYIICSVKYGRDNRITTIRNSRFRKAKLRAEIDIANNYIR